MIYQGATKYNTFEMLSAAKVEKVNEQLEIVDVAYDWTNNDQKVSSIPKTVNFLQTYKNENLENKKIFTIDDFTLSKEQSEVLHLCRQQIELVKNGSIGWSDIIKRVIVQGKSGSGKSTIIKKIEQEIIENFDQEAIAVTAPTKVAAINIGGCTLYSRFSLTLKSSTFAELTNETLRKFQRKNKNLKFIIMDEMSMIEAGILSNIEKRCSCIFPNKTEDFGGLFVYMFGDFKQLPPVRDKAFYDNTFFDEASSK